MNVEVIRAQTDKELEIIYEIRRLVFVVEQNCPPELEYEHEAESVHFLAYADGIPSGASRWRKTENGFKLERFAVLKEFRGKGVGEALLKTVIADLPRTDELVYLHAQLTAVGFYLKNGFHESGDHFWEAGIEHVKMVYA